MKLRIAIVATVSFCLTFGVIGAVLGSPYLFAPAHKAENRPKISQSAPTKTPSKTISGKPIRIALSSRGIDLPVADGGYDTSSKTWSLRPDKAMFATMSSQPNNEMGMTFIYGHGTDTVFGKIGSNHPPIGSTADIYTDNGHVFSYKLNAIEDLTPTDTWILRNQKIGPPRLLIQTCTGAYSQWRTMFEYSYTSVK